MVRRSIRCFRVHTEDISIFACALRTAAMEIRRAELTTVHSGGSSNPDAAIRIVQGSTLKKLFFAQFGDGAEGGAILFSQLVLVDLDPSQAANVTVILKNPDGSPMTVDLNGAEVVGRSSWLYRSEGPGFWLLMVRACCNGALSR